MWLRTTDTPATDVRSHAVHHGWSWWWQSRRPVDTSNCQVAPTSAASAPHSSPARINTLLFVCGQKIITLHHFCQENKFSVPFWCHFHTDYGTLPILADQSRPVTWKKNTLISLYWLTGGKTPSYLLTRKKEKTKKLKKWKRTTPTSNLSSSLCLHCNLSPHASTQTQTSSSLSGVPCGVESSVGVFSLDWELWPFPLCPRLHPRPVASGNKCSKIWTGERTIT